MAVDGLRVASTLVSVWLMASVAGCSQRASSAPLNEAGASPDRTMARAGPTAEAPPMPMERIPDFAAIRDTQAKKAAFFAYLLPKVRAANDEVRAERARLLALRERARIGALDDAARQDLRHIAEAYGISPRGAIDDAWFERALEYVDVIPPSLVLVQAANESAWGTSRFATEGRNFFGLWCFELDCGMVPKARQAGAVHEVRRFRSVLQGVRYYVHYLNTASSYRPMRVLRARLRAQGRTPRGSELAEGLLQYSARGRHYVEELVRMIRQNRLAHLDLCTESEACEDRPG